MLRGSCAVLFSAVLIVLGSAPADSADYTCTNCTADVSAGESHTCAIREDGSLSCWGYDFFGQTRVPDLDLERYDFLQVSPGGYHTCAVVRCTPPPGQLCLAANGLCWGNDDDGQATVPLLFFDHISAGRFHSCGLSTANQIACWGLNDSGQSSSPFLINREYVGVAAGGYHSCAILGCPAGQICAATTNVSCWGSNGWGQTTVTGLPIDFVELSLGGYHSCGLREGGAVECWGRNDDGQASAPAGTLFRQIAAGDYHTCGLRTDGTIECWGRSDFKQSASPAGQFERIAAGGSHTCAVKGDGTVFCWGNDIRNQTVPTAGLCGLFRADFEIGGDCRWSNGGTPCWSADCDGDGYASPNAEAHCQPTMPAAPPAWCPTGGWTDVPAGCGGYDCMDYNPLVFSEQTQRSSVPYEPTGGKKEDRFDFDCNGVEEKRYTDMNSNICCATVGGPCFFLTSPGCDPPGWDTATVAEVPDCGESGDFRICAMVNDSCIEVVGPLTQYCR